nr:4Fe-4S binding protein [Selenomonas ruminantium]
MKHKRCVGCHLCVLVCPTDSIRSSGRRIYRSSNLLTGAIRTGRFPLCT